MNPPIKTDEIGRTFCVTHDREFCRDCYVDYGPINRIAEVKAGLLKAPTEIEALVAERETIERGSEILRPEDYDPKCEISKSGFGTYFVKKQAVHEKLNRLKFREGKGQEIAEAFRAAKTTTCDHCYKFSRLKLMCCGGCKRVYYCGKECQAAGWKKHKRQCRTPQSDYFDHFLQC